MRIVTSLVVLLGMLLVLAVAAAPYVLESIDDRSVSAHAEVTIINDTPEAIGVLGVLRDGREWRSYRPRNGPPSGVSHVASGDARYLVWEREGFDSAMVVIERDGGYAEALMYPRGVDAKDRASLVLTVSALEPRDAPTRQTRSGDIRRLLAPIAGALLCGALALLLRRARRGHATIDVVTVSLSGVVLVVYLYEIVVLASF